MNAFVLVCGNVFDGISDALTGPAEILVEDNRIAKIERSVGRPPGARVIDLSQRTVSPGFIDTHVHLTMDAANLALQTLESSAAKALKGLSLAREYMNYGFTTLRDLGSVDPEWPTIDLRNALNTGLLEGPRLFVAARRSPTISGASERWCGASTPSAATGLRPPTPAAISAPATIRRG
jgi:imidazolonepropionase-like amidohydrolase